MTIPKPGQIWECQLTRVKYMVIRKVENYNNKYIFWNIPHGREASFYISYDDHTWKLFLDAPQINNGLTDAPVL